MKHLFNSTVLVFVFIISGFNIQAQTDETQIIQGMYGMQKRDIIQQNMNLTADEATKFWPVYDAYEAERKKLGAERLQILNEYVNAYPSLTNEQADNIVLRIFSSDQAFDKLHKTYYNKLKKEIGAIRASAFFQLEAYLQSAIRFTIQDNLPFISELEKNKK